MDNLLLEGVSGGYRELMVLHRINLDIRGGEAVGIVGPNGAGKSTLLKVIAGELPTNGGTINFAGESIERYQAAERVGKGISLVPEGRQIMRDLTVEGNLDITLLSRHRIRRDREHQDRLDSVYTVFPQLKQRRRVKGGQLSGGEQQMLAIGRALMCKPRLLLLDEPSLGLAISVVNQLVEVLSNIRGGMTLVIAEHSEVVLEGLTDRRVEVRMGRILAPESNV
ncbi:MAG: ATP-binding cassette domain-containing protein [Acidimicrobiaceae bacterium]|nr:ATP-binding cassette domain-containing protein [Acidimicrobiaceae bacterium]